MNKLNTLTAFLLALSLAPAATARPNRDGGGRSNSGGSAPVSRPAPSYSPPSRPSYSPPAQNYRPSYTPPVQQHYQRPTPTFQQPSYTAPTMQRPSYSPPQHNYQQPSFSTPTYQHPGYTAPTPYHLENHNNTGSNHNPGYQRPSYTAPTPGNSAPTPYHLENHNNTGNNNNPGYQRPSYTAPTPGNSAPTPYHLENHNNTGSNNNPGYQRPSYTAPTPGNSAPTPYHLENHNNTGSNNNPGYQRPSYTAPTPGNNNNSGYQRPASNYQHRDNSASAPANALPPTGYQRPSDGGNRGTGYSAPRTNYQYPQQMQQRQGTTPYSQQNSGYSTASSQRPAMDGGRRNSLTYNPSAQVRNGFEYSNRGSGRPIPSSPAMASPTSRILAPQTTTVTTTTITNTYIRNYNGGYNGYYSGYNGWGYGYYRYWGPRYYCLPYLSVGLYPLFYSSGYYPVYSTGIYSPLCSIVFNSGSAYQNTPTYQNGSGYNGIDQAGASELTDTLVGGPAPEENPNGDNQQQFNNQNPDADPLSYAYNAAEPVKTFQSGEKVIFQVTGVARAQDANTYIVLTPDDRSYLFHTNGQSVDGLGRGPLVTVWLTADRDGNYKLEQVKWKQENQTPGALPRLR